MRDSRAGECLWQEWTGDGLEPSTASSVLFFTFDHVDVEHEVVRRALASALQRDGTSESLGRGYGAIQAGTTSQGYAGTIEGERDLTLCNEHGETYYGDQVQQPLPITWVEVS